MRSLEEVFTEPVLKVMEFWGQSEAAGREDWVLNEAGRYAFKWVSSTDRWLCDILNLVGSWAGSQTGTGQRQRTYSPKKRFRGYDIQSHVVVKSHADEL